MKKFVALIFIALTSVVSAYAFIDKYTIDRSQLPEEARNMLDEHFPKAKISMIKVDRHLLKKTDYDVRFVNGTTVEFNNKGKWTSIDCKTRQVPDGLVPKAIRNNVAKKHSGAKIVKMVKKLSGYEIVLHDGTELKYNLIGSPVK